MKYIILVVCLIAGGYQLYDKLKSAPPPPPPPAAPPAPPVAQVQPAPVTPPAPQGPVQPDLTVIYINGRSKITNCTVRSVTKDSIMFVSDQGLVQGRFIDLPPEFLAYYKPRINGSFDQQRASERDDVRERTQAEYQRRAEAEARARRKVQDDREATVYSRLDANAPNRVIEDRLRRAAVLSQQISSLARQLDDDSKRSSFQGPPPMSSEMRAYLNLELDNRRSELANLR